MTAVTWVGLAVLGGAGAGAAATVVVGDLVVRHTADKVALVAGTAVTWAVATAWLGVSWSLPAVLYLLVLAGALTVTDLRVRRLPNRLVLASYPVVAALLVLAVADPERGWGSVLAAAAWGVGMFAVLLLASAAGGLGGGDVKLAGLVGAYLGWAGGAQAVVLGVVVTVVSAAVLAGIGVGIGRMRRDSTLPYGPFLLLGCLVGVGVGL